MTSRVIDAAPLVADSVRSRPTKGGNVFIVMTTHALGHDPEELHAAAAALVATEGRPPSTRVYRDERQRTLTLVRIYPDAEALESRLQPGRVAPHVPQAPAPVERIAVFGEPGPRLLAALDRLWQAGSVVSVTTDAIAGFDRTVAVAAAR